MDTKELEHTRTPTRGAEGGTRHEEGAPLICGPTTCGGLTDSPVE